MDTETMHLHVKLEHDKTSALELPSFEPEEIDIWLNKAINKFTKTRYGGTNVKDTGFEQTQKRSDDLRTLIYNFSPANLDTGTAYPNSSWTELPVSGSGIGFENYWFTLQEEAEITVDGTASRVGITECTFDEYRQKIDDPFSEHKLHYASAKPLRLVKYDGVYLIHDGNYTITDYFLTYLKKPQTIDVTNVASGSIEAGVTYGVYSTSPTAYVSYYGTDYYSGSTFIGDASTAAYGETGTCNVNTSCDLPEHTHDEIVKMAASMMLENVEQPRYQSHMNEVITME